MSFNPFQKLLRDIEEVGEDAGVRKKASEKKKGGGKEERLVLFGPAVPIPWWVRSVSSLRSVRPLRRELRLRRAPEDGEGERKEWWERRGGGGQKTR